MQYGLCCLFHKAPIKFKTYTWKVISGLSPVEARAKILGVWRHNIDALQCAMDFCVEAGIASYRVGSELLPQFYRVVEAGMVTPEDVEAARRGFASINTHGLILSMHPGQHVNMGSPKPEVIQNSIRDIMDHWFVAEPLGCREINIHIGGSYGEPDAAKARFIQSMRSLPAEVLSSMTIENDELNFNVVDCVEVATELGIRCTFDIHHHRCHEIKEPSGVSLQEGFEMARTTWAGYGYQRIHISSPREGYSSAAKSRPHSDMINLDDVPGWIAELPYVYADIEAKHKETAIGALQQAFR